MVRGCTADPKRSLISPEQGRVSRRRTRNGRRAHRAPGRCGRTSRSISGTENEQRRGFPRRGPQPSSRRFCAACRRSRDNRPGMESWVEDLRAGRREPVPLRLRLAGGVAVLQCRRSSRAAGQRRRAEAASSATAECRRCRRKDGPWDDGGAGHDPAAVCVGGLFLPTRVGALFGSSCTAEKIAGLEMPRSEWSLSGGASGCPCKRASSLPRRHRLGLQLQLRISHVSYVVSCGDARRCAGRETAGGQKGTQFDLTTKYKSLLCSLPTLCTQCFVSTIGLWRSQQSKRRAQCSHAIRHLTCTPIP